MTHGTLRLTQKLGCVEKAMQCLVLSFFYYYFFLSLVNSFSTNSTVKTPFPSECSFPLHSSYHQNAQSRRDLVQAKHGTSMSANVRATCISSASWDTQRSHCHCTSCLPTLTRQSVAQHTSQHISCSCWEALARAAWCPRAQNELNRRRVYCLQQSPGAVSQHITAHQRQHCKASPVCRY